MTTMTNGGCLLVPPGSMSAVLEHHLPVLSIEGLCLPVLLIWLYYQQLLTTTKG